MCYSLTQWQSCVTAKRVQILDAVELVPDVISDSTCILSREVVPSTIALAEKRAWVKEDLSMRVTKASTDIP